MKRSNKQSALICFFAFFVLCGCGSSTNETESPNVAIIAPLPPATSEPVNAAPETKSGFNSLFIGHSFFVPIARGLPEHAENLGLSDHSQIEEFSGGASGAPMALWNDQEHRQTIQLVLDTGEVELFAMTYEPSYPTADGYILWIDYALSKNPETKIVLGLPWIDFPFDYEDAQDYAKTFASFHDVNWKNLVETLRVMYPDIEIVSIPYGAAAIRLRSLLQAGELPGIDELGGSNWLTSIFRDQKGHGHQNGILLSVSELIWLSTIYDIDIDSYDYQSDFEADIKAIAISIIDDYDSDELCCVNP